MTSVTLRPDPGAVFASDEHRRVLGNLPDNEHHPFGTIEEMAEHSREAAGLSEAPPIPVQRTLPELVGWIGKHDAANLGHLSPTDVEEILKDLQADGYVEFRDGGAWAMTERGYGALNGPNGEEPPPLEGVRLEAAKLQDEAIRQAAEEAVQTDQIGVRDFNTDEGANR